VANQLAELCSSAMLGRASCLMPYQQRSTYLTYGISLTFEEAKTKQSAQIMVGTYSKQATENYEHIMATAYSS